jgi:transketolase
MLFDQMQSSKYGKLEPGICCQEASKAAGHTGLNHLHLFWNKNSITTSVRVAVE